MPYRVTAPLLVVKDQSGRNHHTYHGATIHYLNDEQRNHFLRLNLIEELEEETPATPDEATVSGKPPRVASKDQWVNYAVSQGLSREEAEAKSKQELIDALG